MKRGWAHRPRQIFFFVSSARSVQLGLALEGKGRERREEEKSKEYRKRDIREEGGGRRDDVTSMS